MPKQNQTTVTIALTTPITQGDASHTTLVLRKPLGGDLRGLALSDVLRSDIDTLAKLLPRITTNFVLLPEQVYDMDLPTLSEVFVGVASFLKV